MDSYRARARERYLREKERRGEKETTDKKTDTKPNRDDDTARPGKVEGEDSEGKGEAVDVKKKSGFEAKTGYFLLLTVRFNAYACGCL